MSQQRKAKGSAIVAAVPEGYHQNAQGHLVPDDLIDEHDLLRDELVNELIAHCEVASQQLGIIKRSMADSVSAFISLIGEKYGVKIGGTKGNVTLTSYDGLRKIQRARAARVGVGESVLAAEAIIGELLNEWTEGARGELRTIIDRAFRRNQEGQLSVPRLIDLTKVDIKDKRWAQAVKAIQDALYEQDTITYYRAYQRESTDDLWQAIPLDLAAVVTAPVVEGRG